MTGANTVKGPLPLRVLTRSALTTASTRMLRFGSDWASVTKSVEPLTCIESVVPLPVTLPPSRALVLVLLSPLLPPQAVSQVAAPRLSKASVSLRFMCELLQSKWDAKGCQARDQGLA